MAKELFYTAVDIGSNKVASVIVLRALGRELIPPDCGCASEQGEGPGDSSGDGAECFVSAN